MNCTTCLAAGHWCAVHKDETRHLDEYLMRLPLDRKLSIVQQEISNS
jgi:hypothetical protein